MLIRFFLPIVDLYMVLINRLGVRAPWSRVGSPTGPVNNGSIPSLYNVTLKQMNDGLQSRAFTSADLVNTYIARIHEVNQALNAVLEINPDAQKIALELDTERREGKLRGPLHGIPILIKDNIATIDQMQTTAGSPCLLDCRPPRDATVVRLLRKAGAIILGKTNLSEWANYRSANSADGWSARGGQTYGIYHESQYPCGSSSGSAVAASLGLAFASIGTETDGSITCPASYNNVVGIKATRGLIARDLVISGAATQDSLGPIARTVKDAAIILNAIAGPSEYDDATNDIPFHDIPDFSAGCHLGALKGARLGVLQNLIVSKDSSVLKAFGDAQKAFEAAGATIVLADFPNLHDLENLNHDPIVYRGVADGLANYFAGLTSNPLRLTSVKDILSYIKSTPVEEWPHFDTQRFEEALVAPTEDSDTYQLVLAKARKLAAEDGLLAVMKAYDLDAIAVPENSKRATSIAAIGGFPVITVPMGAYPQDAPVEHHRHGAIQVGPNIPFGLQIIGRRFDEQSLIGFAYAYEQATQMRNKLVPIIHPRTDLFSMSESG